MNIKHTIVAVQELEIYSHRQLLMKNGNWILILRRGHMEEKTNDRYLTAPA